MSSSYVDAHGQRHAPACANPRIVSLVPSITELLFALQLDDAVVGRTGFCIHPATSVRGVKKFGGTKDVDIDGLRQLAPSHVIVNIDENTRAVFDTLKSFVPNVIVTHPNAPEDNLDLYLLLGGIFSRQQQAQILCHQFEQAMTTLKQQVSAAPEQKVLYLIWREPWMSISADTYIARMLDLLNWRVVACKSAARYPELEAAELSACGADQVLLSSEPYPFRDKHLNEVRELCPDASNVRLVDGEMLSWYGSRAIAGLAYLSQLLSGLSEHAA